MIDGKMMFRLGGPHVWEKVAYDYVIIHKSRIEEYLKLGWFKTREDARAANEVLPLPEVEAVSKIVKKLKPFKYKDLTDQMLENIRSDDGTNLELSKKYNCSQYCIRKAKGLI